MRAKVLLATILLGMGLCSTPTWSQEQRDIDWEEALKAENLMGFFADKETKLINHYLLEIRIDYMMWNPDTHLYVELYWGWNDSYDEDFPEGTSTKNKLFVKIFDNRRTYGAKTGTVLLDRFKRDLEVIHGFTKGLLNPMDQNIVAKLYTKQGIPLAYYSQGEYHLWER